MVKKVLQSLLVVAALMFTSGAFANKVNESLKVETKKEHGDSLRVKTDFSLFSFFLIEPAKPDTAAIRKDTPKKEDQKTK